MFLLPTNQFFFQHVSGNTAIFYILIHSAYWFKLLSQKPAFGADVWCDILIPPLPCYCDPVLANVVLYRANSLSLTFLPNLSVTALSITVDQSAVRYPTASAFSVG